MFRWILIALLVACPLVPALALEPAAEANADVAKLAKAVRESIVVITFLGREGKTAGLGTGFVIGADGLIATNLHVIGQARPIQVKLPDGKQHDVISVHATDRRMDLAILKIDAAGLKPLPLGDSSKLTPGQAVIAVGNPQGLEHSVVAGVVSAMRTVEERPMIQVAIPIEPGNSGGPLLDMQGRVQGIVNMKSLVTRNLGFAVEINALKPLLEKPNPVTINRWLTIGAMDRRRWDVLFGARWWQRAGHIQVDGWGGGFGGRSLCLWKEKPRQVPFEIGVAVRLDDESGAAGLVFHADGQDKHYGFYPSGGRLRLSRFDGPDVFNWKVLDEVPSAAYRRGQWNWLKVRVEKDRILCFVNDQQVIESRDQGLTAGRVGLAKFRSTQPEFKQFQLGKELASRKIADEVQQRIVKQVAEIPPQGAPLPALVEKLAPEGNTGLRVLRERADRLEQQAEQLRRLAQEVHRRRVRGELAKQFEAKPEQVDLFEAALLLAWYDNDELDRQAYRDVFARMVEDLAAMLPEQATAEQKLAAMNKYLFDELGFHGSRGDYYHRSNSYLNEVLDDREGIPITLCVLYMELGRRIGLTIDGIGLPGHFVVRVKTGDGQLVDVFERGKPLSLDDARTLVAQTSGQPLRDEHLSPAGKRSIVIRMLYNLQGIQQREKNPEGMLSYLDAILTLDPDSASARGMRALLRYQTGRRAGGLADVDWFLKHEPEGIDLDEVRRLRQAIEALPQ